MSQNIEAYEQKKHKIKPRKKLPNQKPTILLNPSKVEN